MSLSPVIYDRVYYNARQTIEAGIKEGKGVFKMQHFKLATGHLNRGSGQKRWELGHQEPDDAR